MDPGTHLMQMDMRWPDSFRMWKQEKRSMWILTREC